MTNNLTRVFGNTTTNRQGRKGCRAEYRLTGQKYRHRWEIMISLPILSLGYYGKLHNNLAPQVTNYKFGVGVEVGGSDFERKKKLFFSHPPIHPCHM